MGRARGESDSPDVAVLPELTRTKRDEFYEQVERERSLVAQMEADGKAKDEIRKAERESRKEFVNDKLRELDAAVARLVSNPEELKTLLSLQAGFYNYSFNNTMLILSQNPNATRCASMTDWNRKHKRLIKKGESGLKILVPKKSKIRKPKVDPATGQIIYEKDASGKTVIGDNGKPKPVFEDVVDKEGKPYYRTFWSFETTFDVSQTRPMDDAPSLEEQAAEQARQGFEDLKAVCEKRGIKVTLVGTEESDVRKNAVFLNDPAMEAAWSAEDQEIMLRGQNLRALAHELAHQTMGHAGRSDGLDPAVKEAQADALAYVICSHYGVEREMENAAYIAGWARTNQNAVREVLNDVHEGFRSIMKDLHPEQFEYQAPLRSARGRKPKRKSSVTRRPASKK